MRLVKNDYKVFLRDRNKFWAIPADATSDLDSGKLPDFEVYGVALMRGDQFFFLVGKVISFCGKDLQDLQPKKRARAIKELREGWKIPRLVWSTTEDMQPFLERIEWVGLVPLDSEELL